MDIEKLKSALIAGNLTEIKNLCEGLNCKEIMESLYMGEGTYYKTPMFFMVKPRHNRVLKYLNEIGVNFNLPRAYIMQATPEENVLDEFYIFTYNTIEDYLALDELKLGINWNIEGESEETALFFASSRETVQFLLRKGLNINKQDYEDRTPLIYNLLYRKHEVVDELVRQGADPNIMDMYGHTALFYVNTVSDAKLLLKYGAEFIRSSGRFNPPLEDMDIYNLPFEFIEIFRPMVGRDVVKFLRKEYERRVTEALITGILRGSALSVLDHEQSQLGDRRLLRSVSRFYRSRD